MTATDPKILIHCLVKGFRGRPRLTVSSLTLPSQVGVIVRWRYMKGEASSG